MLQKIAELLRVTFQSPDFPVSVPMLLKVLEVISPLEPKQMTNLREFLQMKLPDGFPVKLG